MPPPALAVVLLLAVLGAIVRTVPRRLSGPPWRTLVVLAVLLAASVGAFGAWAVPRYGPEAPDRWEPGELRADGLRIVPSGRSDAAEVRDPASFDRPAAREVYRIATRIPAPLNRLHCWCGCSERERHRSALQCFEDRSAVGCGVCQETARIAWRQVQRGVTDPARIQRAVDLEWAPPGARVR